MSSIPSANHPRRRFNPPILRRFLHGFLVALGLALAAPVLGVTTGNWTNAAGNTNSATAAGIVVTVGGGLGVGSCSGAGAGYGKGSLNNTANAAGWYTHPYGNTVAGLPALALVVCFGAQNTAKTVTISFSKPVDNPVLHLNRLGGNSVSGSTRYANSSSWRLTGASATGNLITLQQLSGNPQFIVRPTEFRRSVVYTNGDPVLVDAQSECTGNVATQGTACGSLQVTGTGISSLTFTVTGVAWGNTLGATDGDLMEMAWSVKGSTVTLRKQTTGGYGAFGFSDGNTTTTDTGTSATSSSTTLTTSAGSNPASSAPYRVGDHGRDIVLTETPASGFALQSAACQDQNGAAVPATLSGAALTITAANYRANQDIACTFGNAKTSRVTVTKSWVAGVAGDRVDLSIEGASNATPGTSTPAATTAATAIGASGDRITIKEVFPDAARGGDYETSLTCSGVTVGTTTDRRMGAFTMPDGDVTCTFTNRRLPDLKVTKASNANPAWVVGQNGAQYTLNVTNQGGVATSGTVTVLDALPSQASANWTDPLTSNGWTCTRSGQNVSCRTSSSIAASGTAQPIVLPVNVTGTGDVTNFAAAGGGGDPYNGGSAPTPGAGCTDATHCASNTTHVDASADIVVGKRVDAATPNVGDTVTFTITAKNAGPSDATGVAITDALPAGLAFVGATPSQGSYDETSERWTVGALANGAQASLTLTAKVLSAGALTNTATKTAGDQFDPDTSNNAASASINAQASADLQVRKEASTLTPNLGSEVSFTITVRNAGPSDATGVVIDDQLPAGLNFVSATASVGHYDEDSGTWTLGALANGAEATLSVVATVGMPGELTNTAVVAASDQHDPNPANDSGGVTINGQAADIQIVKIADEANPIRGSTVTFTVTATNNGPSAASGVRVVDALPAGLTFVSATAEQGTYDSASGLWTIGDLAASGEDATATLTLVATVDTDDAVTNTARLDGVDQTDPDPSNNQSQAALAPIASADLSVAKQGPAAATPGTNITYRIVVRNAGPSAAAEVSLADPTPPGLTFVSATAPCASGFPCALGDIAAGDGVTIDVTCAVPSNYAGADPIANTATVSSATRDPDASNDSRTITTPVKRRADVHVRKTGPATATAGSSITYRIEVGNDGPSDADGTTVSDPLPDGLSDAAVSCGDESGGAVCGAFDTSVAGTIATLPAGGRATITVTATAPSEAATLSNTATVAPSSGTTDPDAGNDRSTVDTDVTASANLAVVKSGPVTGTPGTHVTYRIDVNNAGPSAAVQVSLADPTPPGLTFVSADAPCASGFPCALGDIAAGAGVTVNVTYAIAPGLKDTVINTATASSPTPDPDASDNASSATTALAPSADLAIVKTATPSPVSAGQTLTYTLVVSNAGPSDADGARVSDALPAGLRDAAVVCGGESGAVCGSFDDSVAGTIATLPAGGRATITITAKAPDDAATLNNTATLTPPDGVTDPNSGNNQSSVSTQVSASANLSLHKSGPASVQSGAAISYTLLIRNAGPSSADGASYRDDVPAGISELHARCESPGGGAACAEPSVSGNAVSGAIPTLPSGGSVTIVVTGTAPQGAQTLTNSASVAPPSGTADPDTTDNTGRASTDVGAAADIAVTKTVDDDAPNVGENVTFTVTASNLGPNDASGVQITDGLPLGLAYVSSIASQGSYDEASGDWQVGALANGASATLTITATVTQAGAIVNTATRTGGDQLDPVGSNNAGSAGVNAGALADLQLEKRVDEPAPNVGEDVTYTVKVRNAGPSPATQVDVTDVLPAGLSLVSATPSVGRYDSSSGTWTVGDLAADADASLTLVATVTQAGEITNSAAATAAEDDPNPDNNSDGVTINGQAADIQVVKTVDDAAPDVNGTVTYTVTVTNNGPSAATNVLATDALPAGLSFVRATPSQGTYDSESGLWTIGDLAANGAAASATLTLVATVDADQAGQTITNTAESPGGDQTDPTPGNNEDHVVIVPAGVADLAVSKTGPDTATAGTNVAYRIVVSNAGPSTAAQASLVDPTPDGLTFVSADAPCAEGFPCALGDIAAGASVTVNVTYAVPSDYAGADPITNTATVSSATDDPEASNDRSTATTPLVRSADVHVTKTGPATVAAGASITYRIDVSNDGPSDADGAAFSDPLPAGLSDVAVSCGDESGGAVCGAFDERIAGTLTRLPAGGRVTLTVTATAPNAAATLVNTASAAPPGGVTDPEPGNDRSSVTTNVQAPTPLAAPSVTKSVEAIDAQTLQWTIVLINDRNASALPIALRDPLPAGMNFVDGQIACTAHGASAVNDCRYDDADARVVVDAVLQPDPGITDPAAAQNAVVVTFQTRYAAAPAPVTNTAEAYWDANHDGAVGDDIAAGQTPVRASATYTPAIQPGADLETRKTGPADAALGQSVVYTIAVTNHGPDAVADAELDDPTPPGLSYVAASTPCASGFPCALGALASGATTTVSVTYTVQPGYPGAIVNVATTHSAAVPDPNPDNNTDTVTTAIAGVPPAEIKPVPMDSRWMLTLMAMSLLLVGVFAGARRRR